MPFPPLWAELVTFVFQVPKKFLKLKFVFCKEVKKNETAKKQEPTQGVNEGGRDRRETELGIWYSWGSLIAIKGHYKQISRK